MKMTREQLQRYAETGVRQRLHAMQDELNMLAKEFPGIVCNHDGSVPSVLPLTHKKPTTAQPGQKKTAAYERKSVEDRLQDLRAWLSKHPGATTREAAKGIAIGESRATALLHQVAKGVKSGHKMPFTWTLKKS